MASDQSAKRQYGSAVQSNVKKAVRRYKRGTRKSGHGGVVKSRKQAIAIGLSEALAHGAKVPAAAMRNSPECVCAQMPCIQNDIFTALCLAAFSAYSVARPKVRAPPIRLQRSVGDASR